MLVGDLIYNDDLDVNANVAVFDCSGAEVSWHEKEAVFDSRRDGWHKPLAAILNLKIKYITNTIAGSLLSSDREEECVFLCRNLQGTQILS